MAWTDIFSKKAQPAPGSGSFILLNADSSVSRTLAGFFKEGYSGNPIVYSCISVIAKNAASVKLELRQGDGDTVLTTHPLLDLLRKPNPSQNGKEFFKELVTYHQAAGEAFILRLPETGKPAELYNLDPRHIEIEKPKTGGLPVAYLYGSGENKKRYPVNRLTGESQVLHIKGPNLLDDWRGMSPLAAAAVAADTHNAGGKWNFSLLRNSARPSGMLEATGSVNDNVVQQLRSYFTRAWSGTSNAGTMPVLTGGLKFTPLSIDPVDMDFGNSMNMSAKDIALVYGVPLPLVTTDAATFSNMEAAKEGLWSDTVLPLLDEVIEALSDFLAPFYGKGLVLQYNADSVPALEGKRSRKFERMVKAVDSGLLTPNEARIEVGFDESPEPEAGKLYMKGTMRPLARLNEAPAKPGDDNQPPEEDPEAALAKAMKSAGYTAAETASAMAKELGLK